MIKLNLERKIHIYILSENDDESYFITFNRASFFVYVTQIKMRIQCQRAQPCK